MNKLSLIIADTLIHQDAENRYCLNDSHKAAGDNPKHKPANFLRLDSTNALIEELSFSEMSSLSSSEMRNVKPVEVILGKGKEQGTYVVKELVYAYAMWISAAFNLKVIRAYDALVTEQLHEARYLGELLDTQKLLIETQQALISSTDFRIKEAKDTARDQVNKAESERRYYFFQVDGLKDQIKALEDQLERALRSKHPAKQDERNAIVSMLEQEEWSTKDVAEWHYRSVSVIRKIYREDSRGAA